MATGDQIAEMSIFDVVHMPGANGLASPAFQVPLKFMRVFGWQHVEQGVEALICDGEIVSQTRFASDWLAIIGRRKYLRRVLLQPAPLTDIAVRALTRDQLDLTLLVSVKYVVTDPVHVASLADPLSELENLVEGLVAEYIRSKTFEELVGAGPSLRRELARHLQTAPTTEGHYAMTEVLKALPQGDERLFEVSRQKRIEEERRGLVELEGRNAVLEAHYNQEIAARDAELQEVLADRQHTRDMEMRRIELSAQRDIALIEGLTQIGAAGMDPTKLSSALLGERSGGRSAPTDLLGEGQAPPASRPASAKPSQAEQEHAALASLQAAGHIASFELFGAQGQFQGAIVRMPGYEIAFTCPESYPTMAPEAQVRYPSGSLFTPQLRWIPGVSTSLAQAVLSILPQVKEEPRPPSADQPLYRFTMDDDPGEDS